MVDERYVVVTPVRDEARHLHRTVEAMTAQTLRPVHWVIVDDGSSDGTASIAEAAARRHDWISVVRRRDRGARKSGGGVIEAFYDGFAVVERLDWDFLVKLDGDLSFAADYFARCVNEFRRNDRLGIGGGVVCEAGSDGPRVESVGDPPFHVRGATKIYRRACWDQIAPLVKAPGWDTVDEVRANLYGWTTRTFGDTPILQHKPTGSADGSWRNWFKNGVANYVTGYDPVFMVAKCVRRSLRPPRLIAALALASGFCSGYFRRLPRATDDKAIAYLRRQQRLRLLLRPSIYGG